MRISDLGWVDLMAEIFFGQFVILVWQYAVNVMLRFITLLRAVKACIVKDGRITRYRAAWRAINHTLFTGYNVIFHRNSGLSSHKLRWAGWKILPTQVWPVNQNRCAGRCSVRLSLHGNIQVITNNVITESHSFRNPIIRNIESISNRTGLVECARHNVF